MIKYALLCEHDHEFEAWFASADEYDRLKQAGHLNCAQCNSSKVEKQLMAPSVSTSRKKQQVETAFQEPNNKEQMQEMPSGANANSAANTGDAIALAGGAKAQQIVPQEIPKEIRQKIVDEMRTFKKHVEENGENVGEKFSQEARKIHYGEAKSRQIYGQASIEEVAELAEEGVAFMPLPILPEDHN